LPPKLLFGPPKLFFPQDLPVDAQVATKRYLFFVNRAEVAVLPLGRASCGLNVIRQWLRALVEIDTLICRRHRRERV